MPMYPVVVEGVLGLVVAWLLVLSLFGWQLFSRNARLRPKGANRASLEDRMFEMMEEMVEIKSREKVIFKTLRDLADEGSHTISKVAIKRYNPYNEVGGDQSFSVVLLDSRQTGVLITSLHSRAGTRMYAKEVVEGKPNMRLSEEEGKVLREVIES